MTKFIKAINVEETINTLLGKSIFLTRGDFCCSPKSDSVVESEKKVQIIIPISNLKAK